MEPENDGFQEEHLYKMVPEMIVLNGVSYNPINGRKYMGDWGYFTLEVEIYSTLLYRMAKLAYIGPC